MFVGESVEVGQVWSADELSAGPRFRAVVLDWDTGWDEVTQVAWRVEVNMTQDPLGEPRWEFSHFGHGTLAGFRVEWSIPVSGGDSEVQRDF